jgi:hypothetical protein
LLVPVLMVMLLLLPLPLALLTPLFAIRCER